MLVLSRTTDRVLSTNRQILTTLQMRKSPILFEKIILLKFNWELWDMKRAATTMMTDPECWYLKVKDRDFHPAKQILGDEYSCKLCYKYKQNVSLNYFLDFGSKAMFSISSVKKFFIFYTYIYLEKYLFVSNPAVHSGQAAVELCALIVDRTESLMSLFLCDQV